MYDIIVVGAGPAGLTSSIYGRRANKKVLVLESKTYGGQIINTLDIANYPAYSHISGVDFAMNTYNQAKDLGAEFIFERVIDIKNNDDYKEVITEKNSYKGKTVILATGSENRKLGLEDEDKLFGKGISYCATCDGAFYKDKIVGVFGNTNTALKDSIYLSDIASTVYLINKTNTFKEEDTFVSDIEKKDNIKILYNTNITKFNYDKKLDSIDITDKEGNTSNIKIDGLFVAIGRNPENQNFAKLINLDNKGYIIAKEDCHTNVDGIFVAGDNRVKSLRQLVTATSDGAVAATEAIKYINSKRK